MFCVAGLTLLASASTPDRQGRSLALSRRRQSAGRARHGRPRPGHQRNGQGLQLHRGALQILGLKPAGTDGYLQPFTVTTGAKLKSGNELTVEESGRKQTLALHQDFVPFSFSSSGTVTAPLVFAGYGATAPEFNYDDYAGVDVKDKIVVVLRYEPDVVCRQGRKPGPDAAFAAYRQGHQRARPRSARSWCW